MVNKKAVSLMISYVILITIAIAMSITVFTFLKTIANVEPVKSCEEGTSIIISDYQCNEGIVLLMKNNGRFSVNGFILTVGNATGRAPIVRLIPAKADEITKEGFFEFKLKLKPGDLRNANFSNKEKKSGGAVGEVDFEYIRNIKVQPFVIDEESGDKIVCDSIIKQSMKNCRVKEEI